MFSLLFAGQQGDQVTVFLGKLYCGVKAFEWAVPFGFDADVQPHESSSIRFHARKG